MSYVPQPASIDYLIDQLTFLKKERGCTEVLVYTPNEGDVSIIDIVQDEDEPTVVFFHCV